MNDSIRLVVLCALLGAATSSFPVSAQDADATGAQAVSPTDAVGAEDENEASPEQPAATSEPARAQAPAPAPQGSSPGVATTPAAAPATTADPEQCEQAPVFDPSTPRLELQVGGGYSALFHTWRQASDAFMNPGRHRDGLYHGPLFRGEVAFAFGGLSISAIYTHLFLTHDGERDDVQMGLLSGEIGVQCACRGSFYVWSFGVEVGGDLLNGPATTVFASIEHRSMFYVWEGLFLGFDIDIATFIGLTGGGASGGGILGSIFLGYSIG